MRTLQFIGLLVFLGHGLNADSQLNQISQIDGLSGSLITKIRNAAAEKIFVQTDKSLYNSGEKIWFKAFCLNAVSGKPSYDSKTLFVDIVSEQDSIISQVLLHNGSGTTDGSIILPPLLSSGRYWLRSYTRSIVARDVNNIFVLPIYVQNQFLPTAPSRASHAIASKTNNTQSRLELFPEGGSMIAGINCVVAFRAFDADGQPAEITGFVTDNRDSVTTRFKTAYPGLGKFNFEVWANRKYIVHIRDKNNDEFTYPLPALKQTAAQISLTKQDNESINFQVALSDSIYSKDYVTYILGINKDSLFFAAAGKGMYNVAIPIKDIPSGKATLLLFNDKQQIISERNVYVDGNNNLSVDINPGKKGFKPGDKIDLNIAVTGPDKQPIASLLSVAVTNDSLVHDLPRPTISDMNFADIDLPGNDLASGVVKTYSPGIWDLVMLTQKYKYRELWNNDAPLKPGFDKDDEAAKLKMITGTVTNSQDEPVPNIFLTLFSNEHTLIVIKDTSDAKGRFHFNLSEVPEDSTLFTLKTENPKNLKLKVQVDELKLPVFKTPAILKKNRVTLTDQKLAETLAKGPDENLLLARGKELKEVKVTAKPTSNSGAHTITAKDLSQGVNGVKNAILMVPGVQLKSGFVVIHGGTDMFHIDASSEPLVVINGVATPGDDAGGMEQSPVLGLLGSIPVNTIDNITVLSGTDAAFYGARGGNGVILVTTTSRDNHTALDEKSFEKKIYFKSYLKPSLFPVNEFARKGKGKNAQVDNPGSATVFWNGSTLTGKDGKAIYNFYSTDVPAAYTVTVTGITARGNPIYRQVKLNQSGPGSN